MSVLNQHRLLLWKHWTIRKRQPIILSLEFLWPFAIFLIITSVRHIFPPEARNDCVYRARAMPSAGVLPFMQSFLCNLDNKCDNISSYEEIPIYKEGKINHLLNKVYPLIEQPEIQTMLSQLPTLLSIASHAVNALSSKESKEVLSHIITVGDLFKDEETVTNILVKNKMDADLAGLFLNATIDIGQLLRFVATSPTKSISCNPKELSKILLFSNETEAEMVLESVCQMIRNPTVIQNLMMQFNVRGLIEKGVILLDKLESNDIASLLRSFGKIVDALQSIPILDSLASAPFGSETGELLTYLQHAMEFLKTMNDFNLDLDFLGELMDDIERVVGPGEVISHLKSVGKHIHRLISWSRHGALKEADLVKNPKDGATESGPNEIAGSDKKLSTNLLAEDLQDLLTHITYVGNKFGGTMKDAFPAFDITWKIATTAISILLLPDFNDRIAFVNGLASVFETFPAYLPNAMRLPGLHLITAFEVLMKIGINITKDITVANQILLNDINLNSRRWEEASLGTAMISQLAALIGNNDIVKMVRKRPDEIRNLMCNSTFVDTGLKNATEQISKKFFCQLPVTEIASSLSVIANHDKFIAELEKTLSMHGETDVDTSFRKTIRSLCLTTWEFVEVFQNLTFYAPIWKQIASQLKIVGQDDPSWRFHILSLRLTAYNLIINLYTDTIADGLEQSSLSGRSERVMNNVGSMVNLISEEFLSIPGMVIENIVTYWPWVIQVFIDSIGSREKIGMVVGRRQWAEVICNKTEIDRYLLIPDEIHSQQFLEFFCVFSTFIEKDVLNVNWFEKPSVKRVKEMIEDQFKNDTKIDWKKTLTNVGHMLYIQGNLVSVSLDNMQHIEDLYRKTVNIFSTMNITNILKLSTNALTTILEFVDRQLETIIPWGWKHIKALISVLDIFIQYANKEMDKILTENKVETASLTFGLQNFTDLGRKIIRAFPEFTNALTKLLTSRLGDFIGRIFQVVRSKSTPCVDLTMTNLIDFTDEGKDVILTLEKTACSNWKFIISEIIQYPMMFKMLWKFREATRDKDLPVNWSELMQDVNQLIDNSSEMSKFNGAVFPDVIGFRAENAKAAIDNFVDTMNMTTPKKGLRFGLVILDAAVPLLENLMKSEWLFKNVTLAEVLMKNFEDYSAVEQGELSYAFVKVVLKTFDIVLSEMTNFYSDLEAGNNGKLSSVFSHLPTLFGEMFKSFPDYINSFLTLLLEDNFQELIDFSKNNGSVSFAGYCEKVVLSKDAVDSNLHSVSKETVMPVLCRLLTQPDQYFSSGTYAYSWITNAIKKLTLLWENVDHGSVIVHFVDIIQGIGFAMNKTDVLVGSRLEVRREFNDLVGNAKWENVLGSIARLIVKAKVEDWLQPVDFDAASVSPSNTLPSHLVCLAHGTMRALANDLKHCEELSSVKHSEDSCSSTQQIIRNSSFSRFWQLLDDHIIDVFKIVYNSVMTNPSKVKLLMDATNPFNLTCSSPETFFTVPESFIQNNSSSLEVIVKDLCDIEWEKIIGAANRETGNSCAPNMKSLVDLSHNFAELVDQLVRSRKLQLPNYLSKSAWEKAVEGLPLKEPVNRSSNVTQIFANLIDKLVELNNKESTDSSLHYLDIASKALWETMQTINTPLNDNIWNSLLMKFSKKPQTTKLFHLFEDLPKLASTFLHTAINPAKLRSLLKLIWTNVNSESKIEGFCQKFNLSNFLVVPSDLEVSFGSLENLLCAKDWSSLTLELNPSSTPQQSSKSSFDSLNFISTINLLMNELQQMNDVKPEIFKANISDLPWTKKANWRPAVFALDRLQQNLKDPHQLIELAVEYISIVEVFPLWSQVEAYLQFINLQIHTVLGQLRAVKDSNNLYSVLTNVTAMKDLVRDIHVGVKRTSQMIKSYAIKKQIYYFNVHPNDTAAFCQSSAELEKKSVNLSDIEKIIGGKMTMNQLLSILCHAKPNDWLNTFTSDFEMTGSNAMELIKSAMTILPKTSPYNTEPEWSKQLSFNWTMFSETVTALHLFIRNQPSEFYPDFNWNAWNPVLVTFGYALPEIIRLSGETMCPLLPRINYTPFKELLGLVHSQLLKAEEYEKLICELPYLNLTTIYRRLKYDLNLIETFRMARIHIMNISMASVDETDSSCPPLFHKTADLAEVLNELIVKFTNPAFIESIEKCFQKETQAVIVKEIDKYSKLISKGMPLMNFPNISSFTSSVDIKHLVVTILDFMKFQIPVFFPLKNILVINSAITGVLVNAPAEELLTDGAINLNVLASTDYKPIKLAEIFCNPVKLNKFIKLHTEESRAHELIQIFCPNSNYSNGVEIADAFISSMDVSKIKNILPRLQLENLLSWELVVSVGRSIGNLGSAVVDVKGAIGHINFKEAFNDISLHSLARLLLPMLHSTSLQKLSNGLEVLYEVMSPIISGSNFEDNLGNLAEGVKGTYEFMNKNLRNETIPVKDLALDQQPLSSYLLSIGYPEYNLKFLLNTTFNFSALLFDRKIAHLEDILCDLNIMPVLFNLKSDLTTAGLLHRTLCEDHSKEKVNHVLDLMFDNLNIIAIMKNEIHLFMDPIAKKLNLDSNKVREALHSIFNAQKIFPVVTQTFYSLQTDPNIAKMVANLNPSELARGEITGSLVASFGDMLCGHPIRTFEEYFRLLQTTNNRPPVEKEKLEVNSLPSDFCRNMYKQVAYRPAGSVIWGFLKPFIRGKLLFSPDNEYTRRIILQINGTFDAMSASIAMLHEWSNGFKDLQGFIETRLKDMEKLILLPIPNSVAIGLFGINLTNSMANISGILNDMGNPQRLLGAASALSKGLDCFEMDRFEGYATEELLEQSARGLKKSSSFLAGIVFNNFSTESIESFKSKNKLNQLSGLPKHIEYKIRMDIDDVPTTKTKKERFWKPGPEDNFIENMRYLRGFVELQDLVDRAIIDVQSGSQDDDLPGTFIQQFPYPCFAKDDFGFFLRANVPAVTTLAWIFIVAIFVRELVLDRELMVYQIMVVMGLKAWVAWSSWFINCVIVMVITNIGCTLILKYGGVFPNSDLILLFVFLFVFSLSTIMFCYLVSIWFERATIAAIAAVLLYLASYLPFIIVLSLEAQLTFVARVLMNLLMSTSFSQGCIYIARFEEQEEGIQWSNIWKSPIFGDTMCLAWTIIMMAIDTVIYFVIANYFSALITLFRQSIRKKWYMIFYPIFTIIPGLRGISKKQQLKYTKQAINGKEYGGVTKNNQKARVGISVKNLTKVYYPGKGSQIVAVEDLTMDFLEGQITSLLGQSGSGKTTIINMLIGLTTPKSGYASIYDNNIMTEFGEIRKQLGVCPQYNILFELMTIREHLEFYGILKGKLSGAKLRADISNLLNTMKLKDKENERACNLSGGIRRRLSVAIAFVGGSRTIILDEPTSGVDPIVRRSIWDLVVRSKQGRTILLTTHHMDEAEILSDAVVIIHQGKTLCHGSPMDLKKQFGSGYLLNIIKLDGSQSGSKPFSSSSKLKDMLAGGDGSLSIYCFTKFYIPNVLLLEDNASEMVLCLPYHNEDGSSNEFANFFKNFELQKTQLGVHSYFISCTTLEQVFMNICLQWDAGLPITNQGQKILVLAQSMKATNDKKALREENMKNAECNLNFGSIPNVLKRPRESKKGVEPWLAKSLYQVHYTPCTGTMLKWNQFKWLLTKRLHHFSRNWRAFITCIVLPCLFVAVAMGFTLIRPAVIHSSPALLLTPSIYGPSVSSFIKIHQNSDSYSEKLPHILKNPPGIGTTCMADSPSGVYPACKYRESYIERQSIHKPQCSCETPGHHVCAGRSIEFTYDKEVTNTTDIIYDLIYANVTDWLMATHFEFTEQRYGGWQFGVPRHPESIPGSEENTVVWFNNKGYHAMPSYINSVSNVLLRERMSRGNDSISEFGISTYNHPLHLSKLQLGMEAILHHIADVGIAIIFLVAFSFIPAGFVMYLVRERVQGEKRLQYLSGVGPLLYWSVAAFFDIIVLAIPVGLAAIIITIFDLPIYTYGHNFVATLAMLFMFGWATTPLMYILEKIFNEPSLASIVLFCLNVFIGVNTTVCTLLFYLFQTNAAMEVANKVLRYLFLVFPQFAFAGGLIELTKNYIQAEVFLRFGDDTYTSPFSFNILGLNLIILGIQGVVFFAINVILEYVPNYQEWFTRKQPCPRKPDGDANVKSEREKVNNSNCSGDLVRMKDLTKRFNSSDGPTVAVNNICLSVGRGECFGLLGVNGAGKTTTFHMLTGEIVPTSGEMFYKNHKIKSPSRNGSPIIGYCPQFNAIDELLSAEELLSVYAGLKGIPDVDVPLAVYKAIVQFHLEFDAQNISKNYSNGTKRKLSAAIAVLGNPELVLMDEPTTGMDPTTRRLVWQNVQQITKDNRSVILTSHNMEECDALCTRLAIMLDGQFQCLGSPRYLKDRFGDDYMVTIFIKEDSNVSEIVNRSKSRFPAATWKNERGTTLEFVISCQTVELGELFHELESMKHELGIKDFSVSRTTLDQIFVDFVKNRKREGRPTGGQQRPNQQANNLRNNLENSCVVDCSGKPEAELKEIDKSKAECQSDDFQLSV